jgi:hypothetical protein
MEQRRLTEQKKRQAEPTAHNLAQALETYVA